MSVASAIELTPAQPPGGFPSGAPPGAPPGAASFHRALEGELARTAPAEGQNQEGPERVPAQQRPDGARRQEDREGSQDAAQTAAAQASYAQAAGVQAGTAQPASTAALVSGQFAPGSGGAPVADLRSAGPLGSARSLAAAAAAPADGPAGSAGPAGADASAGPDLSTVGSTPAGGLTDPSLPLAPGSPGWVATPPLATVGTQPKPSSPQGGGAEAGEGARTGIAIAQGQLDQVRPGIQVARPAGPHGEEVAASRQAGESTAPATPDIAVAHEPSPQGGGSAGLGIAVPGGVFKGPLDGLSGTGASPDAPTNGSAAPAAEAPAAEASAAEVSPAPAQSEPTADGRRAVPVSELPGTSADTAAPGSTVQLAPPASPVPAASPAPASAAQAPVLAAGVGMQEMIDSVRATIGLAVRQGISQARIALQPAELGEIRVHLSQGADGLIARVTAGTDAAAQALASGRSELHHSLSTIGTSLLRLEIGSFNQPGQGRERGTGDAQGSASSRAVGRQDPSIENDETAKSVTARTSTGPRGELVDVLA